MEQIGVVQIDSVNAVVRSHYLPMFSRLGPYARTDLERLAWGPLRYRQLFECWGHEASLLPLSLYPAMRWRMERAANGQGIYRMLAQFGRERQDVIQGVRGTIASQGPLGAGALNSRTERAGPWWDWSPEKLALEWLFAAGELSVSTRRGFERIYDLTERVIPADVLNLPALEEADAQRALLRLSARALGVATEKDLRDYFRLDPVDTRMRLAELVEAGDLITANVRGWDKPAYCVEAGPALRRVKASALLSPFDSLVWERARTERLFDFHYRLEIYTPSHKRIFGYYVLPFLHNERLVGRVDLRAERANNRLVVHAVHEERRGLEDDAALNALAGQLQALAAWLGLQQIQLGCPSGLANRLRPWLG
ncbi:hypothetical protein GCM10009304_07620 [Pseudomonas matsuisoli]|uniref:Winged helix-turn-helix domain-containing protein n=2 Tax=Pseudomonas matsuisoli TaxID=1515666 RepID=A0A917UTF3_9PSED|nr:hypothetical protein GCM10009304_07620 [Pseudomonas matsuisoli]